MELALVGDDAARVRLKLHFEDTSILSAQQVLDGLSDSWFLLGRHLSSIADLASHIVVAFGLLNSCPHGISLHMEGFTLPPSQPVWLLKDKDVVSVNKRNILINTALQQGKNACSSSFDTFEKIAPHGVKTRALEEFERETGGYESEEEEEEDALETLQKDVGDEALKASSTKLKQKKRKREKMERVDEEGFMKLQVVPYTNGLTGERGKEKKSKKQKLIMQQDDNEKVYQADEAQECRKDKKGQEPESSKAIKSKKKKKDKAMTSKADESVEEKKHVLKSGNTLDTRANEQGFTKLQVVSYTGGLIGEREKKKSSKKQLPTMQQDDSEKVCQVVETQECRKDKKGQEPESSNAIKTKKRKKDQAGKADELIEDPSVKGQHVLKGSNNSISLCTSDSSSDEKVQDEEKKPGLHVEGESVKKCSRSTLRKKAKRRWKRENGGLALQTLQSDKLGDGSIKVAGPKDGAEQLPLAFPCEHEDDGDAEEERLPHVVRPGHLRFEPFDEDDDKGLHSQHPLPLLGWSNGISKRKGQSWGQEKAKKGGKNFEVVDDMEICEAQELKLEMLPALKGTPQNGDVIAYRILELTPSFCPELSEYRVGKVMSSDGHSGIIKLAEVPEYPLWWRHDHGEAETNGGLSFSSLYDQEGFLETQISSLADIRIVEGHLHETCQIATEFATTDNDTILTTITADTNMDISKSCSTSSDSAKPHSATERERSASLEGWLEISEVLERKKEELAKKEGITTTRAIEVDTTKFENGCSFAGNTSSKKEELGEKEGITPTRAIEVDKTRTENICFSAGNHLFKNGCSSAGNHSSKNASTSRAKGWHKKAGGLGSTMALLRSQNVL